MYVIPSNRTLTYKLIPIPLLSILEKDIRHKSISLSTINLQKININREKRFKEEKRVHKTDLNVDRISLQGDRTHAGQERSPRNLALLCFSKGGVAKVLSTKF